jgi:hypothetical protein
MRPALRFIPCILLLSACSGKKGSDAAVTIQLAQPADSIGQPTQASQEEEGEDGPRIEIAEEDINGDGKGDIFHVSERGETGAVMIRREVDLNWDGMIDVRTWLDPDGQLIREEMDGDYDGWIDWVDHYSQGQRTRSEIDTDFDHSLDLILYFEDGTKVIRRMRDSDGDQQMDRNETANCIEIDENADGIFEVKTGAGCPSEDSGSG